MNNFSLVIFFQSKVKVNFEKCGHPNALVIASKSKYNIMTENIKYQLKIKIQLRLKISPTATE